MARIDGRAADQLRPIEIIPNINRFAEGSCLIRCGNTHVLCTASVEDKPPRHVPEGEGWVTAEYSMLPRANRERSRRDISKLKLNGRSAEIQRLIGREEILCGIQNTVRSAAHRRSELWSQDGTIPFPSVSEGQDWNGMCAFPVGSQRSG